MAKEGNGGCCCVSCYKLTVAQSRVRKCCIIVISVEGTSSGCHSMCMGFLIAPVPAKGSYHFSTIETSLCMQHQKTSSLSPIPLHSFSLRIVELLVMLKADVWTL